MTARFRQGRGSNEHAWRIKALRFFFLAFCGILIFRLFTLQVVNAQFYEALSSGQHSFYEELVADRGDIFVTDWKDDTEYIAATNEKRAFVFADTRKVEEPQETAQKIAQVLDYEIPPPQAEEESEDADSSENGLSDLAEELMTSGLDELASAEAEIITEGTSEASESNENITSEVEEEENPYEDYEILLERLSKEDDPYEPIARGVKERTLDQLLALELPGIDYVLEDVRVYPEHGLGGHLFGFVRPGKQEEVSGQYGLEGYFNSFLSGQDGYLDRQTDASGRWIGVGNRDFQPAVDGGDIVLTIDRTIQYMACKTLYAGVERFDADGGSIIILEPNTGQIMAMCSAPDFDPNAYNKVEDVSVYNNQAIFTPYEPGSVFKPLVMAAALDLGVVTPTTLYEDTGEEEVDDYTIRNSDLKAHGIQTMTQVLEKSLNTGMVFVSRQLGGENVLKYVENFGFGTLAGITLDTEANGTIESLKKSSEIYHATGSYGQGITVTPLQLTSAYAVLANGGKLMQPYILEEKRYDNGTVEQFKPKMIRQVISKKTATTISAMLVSVVENGYGENAAVAGYYVAGKTGTAQVAKENGLGYQANVTKVTYSGYGPVNSPQFVMTIMLDHPRAVPWAADTVAPMWGELAEFLMQYLDIPPNRTIE